MADTCIILTNVTIVHLLKNGRCTCVSGDAPAVGLAVGLVVVFVVVIIIVIVVVVVVLRRRRSRSSRFHIFVSFISLFSVELTYLLFIKVYYSRA